MAGPEKVLDDAQSGAVSGIDGTLTESHSIKLSGCTAREFSVDSTLKGATITQRLFWAPPRLYQAIYTRRKGAPLAGDGQKFLDSFALNPAAASK